MGPPLWQRVFSYPLKGSTRPICAPPLKGHTRWGLSTWVPFPPGSAHFAARAKPAKGLRPSEGDAGKAPAKIVIGLSDCSIGQLTQPFPAGALSIKDDLFQGVENQCRLTNPVPVTGMDAILYDADCASEGETLSYRLMLMRTPDGVVLIEDGSVVSLKRCD